MKKHCTIFFFALFFVYGFYYSTPYTTNAQEPTPQPLGTVEVVVPVAKIRSGPGSQYPSITSKTLGEQLAFYGKSEDGSWLLVSVDEQAWIAQVQVEERSAQTVPLLTPADPADPASSGEASPTDPVSESPSSTGNSDAGSKLRDRINQVFTWLKEHSLPRLTAAAKFIKESLIPLVIQEFQKNPIDGIGISLLALVSLATLVLLLLPLLTFRWRWLWGEIILVLFLGPIGLFFCLFITVKLIFDRQYLSQSSPKELYQSVIGSGPVIFLAFALLVILTAVSVLGGILILAPIVIYIKFVEVLLPGGRIHRYIPTSSSAGTNLSSPLSSSEDDDSSSSYEDRYSNSYDDYSSNDRDDDDDDDEKEQGSIWDGWLMKF